MREDNIRNSILFEFIKCSTTKKSSRVEVYYLLQEVSIYSISSGVVCWRLR